MPDWILHSWPPWLSGFLIGLLVPLLYLLTGKGFGISTSLQQIGAMCSPNSRFAYLANYDRRAGLWTLVFVVGIVVGSYLGTEVLSVDPASMLPAEFRSTSGLIRLFTGGICVGFGTRYAGGCTSGHSITGISNLNWPSLVATVFFFIGGVAITWSLTLVISPQ